MSGLAFTIIIIACLVFAGFVAWAVAQGNGDDNEFLQRLEYDKETREQEEERARRMEKELEQRIKNKNNNVMTLNDYQERALETAIYPQRYTVIYPTLGLTGEAGEVADKVKKVIRDGYDIKDESIRHAIAEEIGDVLWYVATLANDLGYSLEDIAEMNNEKLQSRKERNKIHGSGDNR